MTGTCREKNVSAMSSTGGGNTARSRPNKPRTCSRARLVVAVDATIFGPVQIPSARQRHSSSTAASNSPTVVPSAPEIRCSSSWMIRSGGRSLVHRLAGHRRQPGPGGVVPLPAAGPVVKVVVPVTVPRAPLSSPGRTASRRSRAREAGRACPRWRSPGWARTGRSPRRP